MLCEPTFWQSASGAAEPRLQPLWPLTDEAGESGKGPLIGAGRIARPGSDAGGRGSASGMLSVGSVLESDMPNLLAAIVTHAETTPNTCQGEDMAVPNPSSAWRQPRLTHLSMLQEARLDQFRLVMNWNRDELAQWALAHAQREDDALALEAYRRQARLGSWSGLPADVLSLNAGKVP